MDSSEDEKILAVSLLPSPDLATAEKPLAKISCLACRAAKRKCQTTDAKTTCKRCTSHRLVCEYKKHNRGRKRKNPEEVDAARTLAIDLGSGSASSSGPASTGHVGIGLTSSTGMSEILFSGEQNDPSLPESAGTVFSRGPNIDRVVSNPDASSRHRASESFPNTLHDYQQRQSGETTLDQQQHRRQQHHRSNSMSQSQKQHPQATKQLSTSGSTSSQIPRSAPFTQSHSSSSGRVGIQFSHVVPIEGDSSPYMSGTGKIVPPATTDASPNTFDRVMRQDCPDPVTAGLLTQTAAFDLFNYYFDHLNVTVAVLDPVLHTASACREKSSLLFTAVLTVTAKVIRPKIYTSCLLLANKLLGQAVEFGLCSLEIVQAILLLTHWKKADDGTSWRRTGYAVRMAQELRLNVKGPRPLPRNERMAREVLNHERVWLNLIIADYHLAIHHSLPRMIAEEIDDPAEWAKDHPQITCPGESTLAPWVTFSRMCRLYADALAGMKGDASNLRLLNMIEAEWKRWRFKWLEKNDEFNFRPEQISTIRLCDAFYFFHIAEYKLLFNARYRNEGGLDIQHPTPLAFAFAECIDAALGVASVFQDGFVRPAFLTFCFNLVWVALAVTSVWLVKNIVSMTPVDRERVIRSLSDIKSSTEEASRSSDDMPAYMHRLAKHLLSGISPEWQISSLVSPLQTTTVLGGGNANGVRINNADPVSSFDAEDEEKNSNDINVKLNASNDSNNHNAGTSTSTQDGPRASTFTFINTDTNSNAQQYLPLGTDSSIPTWMMPSSTQIIQDQLWNTTSNSVDVSHSVGRNVDLFGQQISQYQQEQHVSQDQQDLDLLQQHHQHSLHQGNQQQQMNLDMLFPAADDEIWKILFPPPG